MAWGLTWHIDEDDMASMQRTMGHRCVRSHDMVWPTVLRGNNPTRDSEYVKRVLPKVEEKLLKKSYCLRNTTITWIADKIIPFQKNNTVKWHGSDITVETWPRVRQSWGGRSMWVSLQSGSWSFFEDYSTIFLSSLVDFVKTVSFFSIGGT